MKTLAEVRDRKSEVNRKIQSQTVTTDHLSMKGGH